MRRYVVAGASVVILLGVSALLVIRTRSADSMPPVAGDLAAVNIAVDQTDNSQANAKHSSPELAGANSEESVPAGNDADTVPTVKVNPANAITRLGDLLVGGNSACNPRVAVCE